MCGGRVVCLFVLVCCSLFAVSCVASFVVCFVLLLCLVVACGSGCCVFVRRVVISLFIVCCLLFVVSGAFVFYLFVVGVCVCLWFVCCWRSVLLLVPAWAVSVVACHLPVVSVILSVVGCC